MDYGRLSVDLHMANKGKLACKSLVSIRSKDDLSVAYTPGVAAVCEEIASDLKKSFDLTLRGRTVAIVSDGSAVLGLGDIGPEASLPVMEGKAIILKELAGVDAFPVVIKANSPDEIVSVVRSISPTFGAINLEDIKAPDCFIVEDSLKDLGIPVFHDDQHGTAIACLAALKNALKRVNKGFDSKIVINGAGAAGIAIAKLLLVAGYSNIFVLDSKGVLSVDRTDLNTYKKFIAEQTKASSGDLRSALKGADVFIGVSKGNLLSLDDLKLLNTDAVVFAMANPTPEVLPEIVAKADNVVIYATGRSDLPNQINNAVVFPGLFKGLLAVGAKRVNNELFVFIAEKLAALASEKELLPPILSKSTHDAVADAIMEFYSL